MNENKLNLKKHSAMIQISNKITLQQRKAYNYLLYNAKELLKKDSNLQYFKTTISELKRESGIKATDNKQLKSDIETLQTTLVQFNLLEKDKESWLSMQLLGEVQIKKGDSNIIYHFAPTLRNALLNPNIYGLVDISIIKGFESKYSIALYELLEDYKNVSIPKITIEKFRELMNIEDKYNYFGQVREKVIEVAINEINEKTDFKVSYDVDSVGRKVVAIKFNHTYENSTKELEVKKTKKFTNFKEFQKFVIDNFKDKKICNGVDGYFQFVTFSLNDIGYIYNDYANELLQADESLKVWSWLFKNQNKLGVLDDIDEELIEAKKLVNTKFKISTRNALGGLSVMELILKDVKKIDDKFEIYFNDVNNPTEEPQKSQNLYSLIALKNLLGIN